MRGLKFTASLFLLLSLLSLLTEQGEAGTPKPKPPQIAADDQCLVSSERSLIHVLLDITYTQPEPMHIRYIYQLDCDADTDECVGIQFSLSSFDRGKPIRFLELNRMNEAKVIDKTGRTSIIKWGPYRTFTIDWGKGIVQYVESGQGLVGYTEGRATSRCQVDDFRPCSRDEDCFGGLQCSGDRCIKRFVTDKELKSAKGS